MKNYRSVQIEEFAMMTITNWINIKYNYREICFFFVVYFSVLYYDLQFFGCDIDGSTILIDIKITNDQNEAFLYFKLKDGRVLTFPSILKYLL